MAVSAQVRQFRDIIDSANQTQALLDIFQIPILDLHQTHLQSQVLMNPQSSESQRATATTILNQQLLSLEQNILQRTQGQGAQAALAPQIEQFVATNITPSSFQDISTAVGQQRQDLSSVSAFFATPRTQAQALEFFAGDILDTFNFSQAQQGLISGAIAPDLFESLRADLTQTQVQRTGKGQRSAAANAIADLFLQSNLNAANRGTDFIGDIRFEATAERELLINLGRDLQQIAGGTDAPSGFVRFGKFIEQAGEQGGFSEGFEDLLPNTGETADQFRRRLSREIEARTVQTELDLTSPFFRDRFGSRRTLRRARTTETGGSDVRLGAAQPTGVLI